MEQDKNLEPKMIYCYSRKQALEDGFQAEVSETAREAGIKFPVFITTTVYDRFVAVPEGVTGQDEAGRLWDVVWMLRHGIASAPEDQNPITFKLYVRNTDDRPAQLISLKAECGALDFDDPRPAITIMLPDED